MSTAAPNRTVWLLFKQIDGNLVARQQHLESAKINADFLGYCGNTMLGFIMGTLEGVKKDQCLAVLRIEPNRVSVGRPMNPTTPRAAREIHRVNGGTRLIIERLLH